MNAGVVSTLAGGDVFVASEMVKYKGEEARFNRRKESQLIRKQGLFM